MQPSVQARVRSAPRSALVSPRANAERPPFCLRCPTRQRRTPPLRSLLPTRTQSAPRSASAGRAPRPQSTTATIYYCSYYCYSYYYYYDYNNNYYYYYSPPSRTHLRLPGLRLLPSLTADAKATATSTPPTKAHFDVVITPTTITLAPTTTAITPTRPPFHHHNDVESSARKSVLKATTRGSQFSRQYAPAAR